jgi:hypothetical protein
MQQAQTIQVLVRARPLPADHDESREEEFSGITVDEDSSVVSFARDKKGQSDFQFTKVFNSSAKQKIVFAMCNLVHDVIDGINCCVMAYGQTGSGKTYTMYGSGWEEGSILDRSQTLHPPSSSRKAAAFPDASGLGQQSQQLLGEASDVEGDPFPLEDSMAESLSGSGIFSKIISSSAAGGSAPITGAPTEAGGGTGSDEEGLGIVPRSIALLFRELEAKAAADPRFDFSVSKYPFFCRLFGCSGCSFIALLYCCWGFIPIIILSMLICGLRVIIICKYPM